MTRPAVVRADSGVLRMLADPSTRPAVRTLLPTARGAKRGDVDRARRAATPMRHPALPR